jgi:hypothetical protein
MGANIFGEGVEVVSFITDTAGTSHGYGGAERRMKPRLRGPFPSLVRGVEAGGEAFEAETVLDDISAVGLHLQLKRRVETGTPVFVVTMLKRSSEPETCAPRVALRCVVLRSERRRDGSFSIAASILHHRFLDP